MAGCGGTCSARSERLREWKHVPGRSSVGVLRRRSKVRLARLALCVTVRVTLHPVDESAHSNMTLGPQLAGQAARKKPFYGAMTAKKHAPRRAFLACCLHIPPASKSEPASQFGYQTTTQASGVRLIAAMYCTRRSRGSRGLFVCGQECAVVFATAACDRAWSFRPPFASHPSPPPGRLAVSRARACANFPKTTARGRAVVPSGTSARGRVPPESPPAPSPPFRFSYWRQKATAACAGRVRPTTTSAPSALAARSEWRKARGKIESGLGALRCCWVHHESRVKRALIRYPRGCSMCASFHLTPSSWS